MSEQFYDKNNRPIFPGDLLRTFHYTGARRKKYFLYHTVVKGQGDFLYMVPVCHLEPTFAGGGGRCLLKYGHPEEAEIIYGSGPDPYLCYDERPRRK